MHAYLIWDNAIEITSEALLLLVPSSKASLQRMIALMEKYHGLPMDFADATLVALGEESEIDQVFTLDRRGFSIYRLHGKKAFRLSP